MLIIAFFMTACKKDDENNNPNPGDGDGDGEEDEWVFDGPTVKSNKTGAYDGYDYEFWTDGDAKGEMTLGAKGTFSCTWESTVAGKGNFLARSGKKIKPERLHADVGTISVDYNAKTYSPVGSGVSYLCVYGWTRADTNSGAPLVEYYIVDNWGTYNRPPGSWTGAVSKGTIEIDGGTYDIYQTPRTNMPSIEGNKTFQQYWSVNRERRSSGKISVSEHFKAWENIDMKLGKLYEVSFCVEGYNIKGSAEITKNTLLIE
jgi:Glycosyl hydrolases family 11.